LSESNLDASSHGHVIVSSDVGGKGIALSKADGSLTDGSLALGPNWQIDVTGTRNDGHQMQHRRGDDTLHGARCAATLLVALGQFRSGHPLASRRIADQAIDLVHDVHL
jgi:hypothetical protein